LQQYYTPQLLGVSEKNGIGFLNSHGVTLNPNSSGLIPFGFILLKRGEEDQVPMTTRDE